MATLDRFYQGLSDTDLAKDDLLKSGDVFILLQEYSGTGVLDLTTPEASTFTITTTDFETDKFNSVGNNLYFLDDNSVVWKVPIDDTTQGSTTGVITFDATAAIKESDGSTDASSSLTDGTTYSLQIWTPTTASDAYSGIYGRYLGWQDALTTNLEDTEAMIKVGIPKKLKDKGLVERVITVNGTSKMAASIDTLKLLYGGVDYGQQTSYTSFAVGYEPAAKTKVKLIIVNEDRNGRRISNTYISGTMKTNGETDLMAEEFKSITWQWEGESDSFYPVNSDGILISKAD